MHQLQDHAERPSNIRSLTTHCDKFSTSQSRDKQIFLIRLVHRTLPTLHWLHQVKSQIYTSEACPACRLPDTIEHVFSPNPAEHCHIYREIHEKLKQKLIKFTSCASISEMTEPFLTSLVPRFATATSIEKVVEAHHTIYNHIRELWDKHQQLVRPIINNAQLRNPSSNSTQDSTTH